MGAAALTKPIGAGHTGKMRPVHDALSPSPAHSMIGHHLDGMADDDAPR